MYGHFQPALRRETASPRTLYFPIYITNLKFADAHLRRLEVLAVSSWQEQASTIVHIALGLNYIGFFDELPIFNRPLNGEEVVTLFGPQKVVTSLLR